MTRVVVEGDFIPHALPPGVGVFFQRQDCNSNSTACPIIIVGIIVMQHHHHHLIIIIIITITIIIAIIIILSSSCPIIAPGAPTLSDTQRLLPSNARQRGHHKIWAKTNLWFSKRFNRCWPGKFIQANILSTFLTSKYALEMLKRWFGSLEKYENFKLRNTSSEIQNWEIQVKLEIQNWGIRVEKYKLGKQKCCNGGLEACRGHLTPALWLSLPWRLRGNVIYYISLHYII